MERADHEIKRRSPNARQPDVAGPSRLNLIEGASGDGLRVVFAENKITQIDVQSFWDERVGGESCL